MIETVDVSSYHVRYRDIDLRRDMHDFVNYVSSREIKRRTNGNDLSVSDVKRLAKILSYDAIMEEHERWGWSAWLNFVDYLALSLEFIDYDTKGKYRGYSSAEPSFPNNYMHYKPEVYESFLSLPLDTQENRLLTLLIYVYEFSVNEFFAISPVGWLDGFPSFGSAVGTLPLINFAEVRNFLLNQLKDMETGVWYSTASWIQRLKKEQPYFLIPESPQREKRNLYFKKKNQAPEYESIPRYDTFYEMHWRNSRNDNVPDNAPDGFERVEGRYIERFLEYIPFLMGYVDLAYDPDIEQTTHKFSRPDEAIMRDAVKAFRVNPLLKQTLENNLPSPTVTVQPNFEVLIESPVYPASLLKTLSDFGKVTHQDRTTMILLDKKSIAAAVAKDESLDVIQILASYSERALPQNILIELKEWVQHADVFTLYEDLQLVEDHLGLDTVRKQAIQTIQEGLYLIPNSIPLAQLLRKQDQIILHLDHSFEELQILPDGAQSFFPTQQDQEAQIVAEDVNIQLEKYTTLHFPHRDALDAVRQGMLDRRCPVTFNASANTLTFPARFQAQLDEVIQSLVDTYLIHIEELS